MKPPTKENRNAAPTVAAVIPASQSSAFSVNKIPKGLSLYSVSDFVCYTTLLLSDGKKPSVSSTRGSAPAITPVS